MNLGRCERTLKFRFYLQLCLGLRKPSLPCLRACFFDRFPRRSREPYSDVCSPVRASRSLAPPTERGDPELEGYLLEKGDTEVLFSVVLEICLVRCCCSAKSFS